MQRVDIRMIGGEKVEDGTLPFSLAVPARDYQRITPGTPLDSGDNTLVAAPGAGKRIALKDLGMQNRGEAAITVTIEDDGTGIYEFEIPAGQTLSAYWPSGEEERLSENTALVIDASAGSGIYVTHGRYFVEEV